MIDWLEISRGCASELDTVFAGLPTRVEREPVVGPGEGGDDTTAIDAAAEGAIVRRLEELGIGLTLVSEEIGVRVVGSGGPLTVKPSSCGSISKSGLLVGLLRIWNDSTLLPATRNPRNSEMSKST